MAEYGEWTRKGATLSDVTAKAEYGITEEFIVRGIRQGRLEYRDGAIWGNPYLRVLRSQLEAYIAAELGQDYLQRAVNAAELRSINRELAALSKKRKALEQRKKALEAALGAE